MTHLLVAHNKGLKAKNAIKQVRNFSFPPRAEIVAQIKALCHLVDKGFKLEKFPGADDPIRVCGEWVKKNYLKLYKECGDEKKLDDILNPISPQSEDEITTLLSLDAKMTQLLASAISKWIKDANTYEDARKRSAALQLKNADVPDDQINNLINDPEQLRKFIQDQRGVLIQQLTAIRAKIEANNATDLPTLKDMNLYRKHQGWFESDDSGENNPYPNDNAVVYSFLIIEIFMLIKSNGGPKAGDLWQAFETFGTIFMNANKNDSNNKAWLILSSCPDYMVNDYNVGKAMREYVSDKERCAKSQKSKDAPKLQSGLQRGPRRLDRIISISLPCTSQFTILNLDGLKMVQNLLLLYGREQLASAAISAAKTIQKGAEGLSDAESIAWLCCLGRVKMLPIATGRNDCSLPKLVGALVNVDVSAFAQLTARKWAVTRKGA